MTTPTIHHVTLKGQTVNLGDEFESLDYRDTDPQQPNNRRRVRVVGLNVQYDPDQVPTGATATITNLTTLRETSVNLAALVSRKWRRVHDATIAAEGLPS